MDYRYVKQFRAHVKHEDGNTYCDTFGMLVRDIDKGVKMMVEAMCKLMEASGCYDICEDR